MKKETVNAAKTVAGLIVGFGVTEIVMDAVSFVAPVKINAVGKLLRLAGSGAMSGFMAQRCSDYAEKQIDAAVEKLEKNEKEEETDKVTETV